MVKKSKQKTRRARALRILHLEKKYYETIGAKSI